VYGASRGAGGAAAGQCLAAGDIVLPIVSIMNVLLKPSTQERERGLKQEQMGSRDKTHAATRVPWRQHPA